MTVLAKGFRPFFLLGAAFAAGVIPLWLLVLAGKVAIGGPLVFITWHAHEMIFGFTIAVVAGFLLTAVGNWTGRETAVGGWLGGLAGLWVAGRIAMVAVPGWGSSVVDLLFLPALAVAIGRPIVSTGNRRNLAFVVVLLGLAAANLVVHFDAHGVLVGWATPAHRVAVMLITVIVLVVTGRVVPMFTRNATGVDVTVDRRADGIAVALVLLMAGLQVVAWPAATGVVGVAGALAVLWRGRGWGARHTFGDPLLWVLHAGHLWIAVGLLLLGLAPFAGFPPSLGLHALTVGAIGMLTLGMMARVSLGHTGRPLRIPAIVGVAFGLLLLGAVIRVFGPMVAPELGFSWWLASGTLWAVAFLVYVVSYVPVLVAPRVDGRPG